MKTMCRTFRISKVTSHITAAETKGIGQLGAPAKSAPGRRQAVEDDEIGTPMVKPNR